MGNVKKPLIDAAGEVRELTATDLKKFDSASDALPPELQAKIGMRRHSPKKETTKNASPFDYRRR